MLRRAFIGLDRHPPHVARRHCISIRPDGQMVHEVDDEQRAVIPPEGWDDYARDWPEAADVARQARHTANLSRPKRQPAARPKRK